MKADPAAQRRLLDVQAIDLAIAQLAHRRRNLPEHAELDRLAKTIASLDDERATARVAVDDLDRDIARIERDVEQVRTRKDRDQARLDSGTGAPRDLEAIMHEIGTLTRRQTELEDSELELMERREQAQATLEGVERRLTETRTSRDEVERGRDDALRQIERDEENRSSSREPLVMALPAELYELYERIRSNSGGIGAALLRAGRCEGCRIELSGSELAAVRSASPDEVLRHEECRRILVRTAESGL